LAFLIPLIEVLQHEPAGRTAALVLLPTRELAMQVHEQYEQLRTKTCLRPPSLSEGIGESADPGPSRRIGLVIATPTVAGPDDPQVRRSPPHQSAGSRRSDRMLDMVFFQRSGAFSRCFHSDADLVFFGYARAIRGWAGE